MSLNRTIVALVGAAAFSSIAGAATLVIGVGPEKDCFEAAKAQRATNTAFQACNEALENSPLAPRDRAATYSNRAVLYLARESPHPALVDADAALRIEPTLAGAAVNRSAALIRLERYREARETLDAIIPMATGEELENALFNRSVALESLGDVKGAYHDLKRAITLNPAFEPALIEIARYEVVR